MPELRLQHSAAALRELDNCPAISRPGYRLI
jgi:hypothetical protein